MEALGAIGFAFPGLFFDKLLIMIFKIVDN